jgi:hypothetical protein
MSLDEPLTSGEISWLLTVSGDSADWHAHREDTANMVGGPPQLAARVREGDVFKFLLPEPAPVIDPGSVR